MTTTAMIPGEMFLLLTTEAGRPVSGAYRQQSLAAAVITELLLREKVRLEGKKNPEVEILDASPTGDAILDAGLQAIGELRRTKMQSVLGHGKVDPTQAVGEQLSAAGILEPKGGIFGTTWPTVDPGPRQALFARLAAAVHTPSGASMQDVILLEMLRAQGLAHRLLKDQLGGMSRKDLEKAIDAFDLDHPGAEAVKRIKDDMAAMMVIMSATIVTTSS